MSRSHYAYMHSFMKEWNGSRDGFNVLAPQIDQQVNPPIIEQMEESIRLHEQLEEEADEGVAGIQEDP